jgi:hypothetical protein
MRPPIGAKYARKMCDMESIRKTRSEGGPSCFSAFVRGIVLSMIEARALEMQGRKSNAEGIDSLIHRSIDSLK